MKLLFLAASLSIAVGVASPASAVDITLSEYTAGQQFSSTSPSDAPGYYWGMSLFIDDNDAGFAGYNDLSVSLFGETGSVGIGELYAFTSPMFDTNPSDLASLDPFSVGTASNGVWQFSSTDYFVSNQYYHFYSDTFITDPVYGFGNAGDNEQGFWFAVDEEEWKDTPNAPDVFPSESLNYTFQPSTYLNHRVEGSGVESLNAEVDPVSVPEPAPLFLLGASIIGLGFLKRKGKRA